MIAYFKYLLSIFAIVQCCLVLAQEDGGKKLRTNRKNPLVKTRFGISPVLGLYQANKNHTKGTKPKMAFHFSWKEEIRLDNNNQNFFLVILDFL